MGSGVKESCLVRQNDKVGEKMKRIGHLLWIGLASGMIFGLVLKAIQAISGKQVYTLLLNVDYLPWFRDQQFHEVTEFSFHLLVSVIVVVVLYWLLNKIQLALQVKSYVLANVFIGGMLFSTTSFSMRTPDVLDAAAFGLWIIAHMLYGYIVGKLIQKMLGKEVT